MHEGDHHEKWATFVFLIHTDKTLERKTKKGEVYLRHVSNICVLWSISSRTPQIKAVNTKRSFPPWWTVSDAGTVLQGEPHSMCRHVNMNITMPRWLAKGPTTPRATWMPLFKARPWTRVALKPPFSLLSLLITVASQESPLLLHLSPQPLTEML